MSVAHVGHWEATQSCWLVDSQTEPGVWPSLPSQAVVFTTWSWQAAYDNPTQDRLLRPHWERLMHDAQATGYTMPWHSYAHWYEDLLTVLVTLTDSSVYRVRLALVVNEGLALQAQLTWQPSLQPIQVLKAPLKIQAVVCDRAHPELKLANYQAEDKAKRQANEAGWDDVVRVTSDGFVAEGSHANVWFIAGNLTLTTPATQYCLAGITRSQVLTLARQSGWTVCEEAITPHDVVVYQGAFLTNAVQGIVPIGEWGWGSQRIEWSYKQWEITLKEWAAQLL